MKKATLIIIPIILIALAVGGYYVYQQKVKDYPIALFENFVKSNLVSSASYKRVKAECIFLQPGKNAKHPDGSWLVKLYFTSQNRMGVVLDGTAFATLISRSTFEELSGIEISDVQHMAREQRIKDGEYLKLDDLRFYVLSINNTIFNDHQLELLNSGDWTFSFNFSIWNVPTPTMGVTNFYESRRISEYGYYLDHLLEKVEKFISEKRMDSEKDWEIYWDIYKELKDFFIKMKKFDAARVQYLKNISRGELDPMSEEQREKIRQKELNIINIFEKYKRIADQRTK